MQIYDIAFHGVDDLDTAALLNTMSTEWTLVVSPQTPALAVAEKAARDRIRLILVTDEDSRVRGLVLPNWVTSQIATYKQQDAASLDDALQILAGDPTEALRQFHHEWLNEARPPLFFCAAGSHYVDECPCPVPGHEGQQCSPVSW